MEPHLATSVVASYYSKSATELIMKKIVLSEGI